ncbi:MAG: hypothetical protein A2018_02275 [Alphaproteobacteria bacterium GWF2_58_20]|nr:MAG: hypothetical protein A2018_02275 [Alphaproteobacteria bacterium GWF2_58_20]
MPATEQMSLFRQGKLSPCEVLEAQLRRMEAHNTTLLAVTEAHVDEARAMARESGERYRRGEGIRPLEGLTMAVKDEVGIKGWRITAGALANRQASPAIEDCSFGSCLRASGAVLHVQTNVPEYYCNVVTWNRLWGITRNPWNQAFSPGGSSGGSAAALAAGFSTLATGSDMGGSIRIPASQCGLFGFKPPYGRVATSLMQMESEGPLARNFADMALMQDACSGPSPRMPSTLKPRLAYPMEYPEVRGLVVAVDFMDAWGIPLDVSVRKGLEDACARLEAAGARVEEVDLGLRATDFEIYAQKLFSTYMADYCFEACRKAPDQATPYLLGMVSRYGNVPRSAVLAADQWVENRSRHIQEQVFQRGMSAILMPTLVTPYLPADLGRVPERSSITINGEEHAVSDWEYSMTWLWNMMGWYPVVNVPAGQAANGMPVGIQVVGNTYEDLEAFRVANALAETGPAFFRGELFPDVS